MTLGREIETGTEVEGLDDGSATGSRLTALYPLGPIFDGLGLNITVLSYMNTVGFGLLGARELMPRLWDLATGVTDATAELKKLARRTSRSRTEARGGRRPSVTAKGTTRR